MLSVICPVYNEQKFIRGLLEFFLLAKPEEKELLIIDGGSVDGTTDIIKEYTSVHPNIRLFYNPHKFVPFALNTAITQAKGEIIVRLDAHTLYAEDYLQQVVKTFEHIPADIVGGPMRAIGETSFQKAVAIATSTPMGVGNSQFHFENYSGYTDSVYLGAWKSSIFSRTGLFDVQMKRNQDDEFHYRAKSLGYRIYLNSDIRSYYYPRSTAGKLFRQYFEYGLYKPLVLKKIKSEVKLRHLIPAGFVLYLISLAFIHFSVWFIPLAVYTLAALFFAANSRRQLLISLYTFFCFYILHIAYGLGFLAGIKKLFNKAAQEQTAQLRQTA
jgi:succinoglycan biosynthesis protein ExoA